MVDAGAEAEGVDGPGDLGLLRPPVHVAQLVRGLGIGRRAPGGPRLRRLSRRGKREKNRRERGWWERPWHGLIYLTNFCNGATSFAAPVKFAARASRLWRNQNDAGTGTAPRWLSIGDRWSCGPAGAPAAGNQRWRRGIAPRSRVSGPSAATTTAS